MAPCSRATSPVESIESVVDDDDRQGQRRAQVVDDRPYGRGRVERRYDHTGGTHVFTFTTAGDHP